jgi:hypothetical protein
VSWKQIRKWNIVDGGSHNRKGCGFVVKHNNGFHRAEFFTRTNTRFAGQQIRCVAYPEPDESNPITPEESLYFYPKWHSYSDFRPNFRFNYASDVCFASRIHLLHFLMMWSRSNIWLGVRIMKPLTMLHSPFSCCFLLLRYRHSPQHSVPKYPQCLHLP